MEPDLADQAAERGRRGPGSGRGEPQGVARSEVAYFDADFAWEEVAEERKARCAGPEAPPTLDEEDVAQRTDEAKLAESWECFYAKHNSGFFKKRSYLSKAFPAIADAALRAPERTFRLGELGCGTGAAVIPLLKEIPQLVAQTVDVSPSAIEALREEAAANGLPADRLTGAVCDIVRDSLPMEPGSLDFGLLVFTLSAISPRHHLAVVRALASRLRAGGLLCFRDYGLFDMVQTRCKTRLGDNWYDCVTLQSLVVARARAKYIKQDGVQCYFFAIEYLEGLFASLAPELEMRRVDCKYATIRNVNRKTGQHIDRVFLNATFERVDRSLLAHSTPDRKL